MPPVRKDPKTKRFHLCDVLTLATHYNVSVSEKGLKELVSFLTGKKNWPNRRWPALAHQCRHCLIKQFPQFNSPEMECALEDFSARLSEINGFIQAWIVTGRWLNEQIAKYGEYVVVESMV